MSIFTPDRDLSKLDEAFLRKVKGFLAEVEPMGIFVTEAFRSSDRQAYLYAMGLSKVITSNHQLGLAIDIAFKDDPRTEQIEKDLYPLDYERWREVADIAKKYNIDWGFDLWQWDKPHFQDNGERYITEFEYERIEKENKVFAQKAKEVNDALHNLNAVTKTLCELKQKEFIPYTIEKKTK